MGTTKPGSDAETPDLCANCGMPPCPRIETIPITLLFSKVSKQVVCVEAGKDFVDMLMGFLTLPIGCIVRLLAEATMIHKPEAHLPPMPAPLTFPPSLPYTPAPKKQDEKISNHFAMSSISNVFDSVHRLEENRMCVDKSCLLDPKPAMLFGAGKLLNLHNTPTISEEGTQQSSSSGVPTYYGCGMACNFGTAKQTSKCPKHKKKMNTAFLVVEDMAPDDPDFPKLTSLRNQDPGALGRPAGRQCAADACVSSVPLSPSRRSTRLKSTDLGRPPTRGLSLADHLALTSIPTPPPINTKGGGYVKAGTDFMITNTLEIFASSAIKALITLNMIRSERVGDLDMMEIFVVAQEVLELLKVSFTSTNVLNEVFGKYCADVKGPKVQDKSAFFFPQCGEDPCCQCERMGVPKGPTTATF